MARHGIPTGTNAGSLSNYLYRPLVFADRPIEYVSANCQAGCSLERRDGFRWLDAMPQLQSDRVGVDPFARPDSDETDLRTPIRPTW